MIVIGLTGGIATGKSTVARMFQELGAHLIDLDELSRKVVEPGRPGLKEIQDRFGSGVVRADGTLDREALGRIVFSDKKARKDLEAIVHPRVWEEKQRILDEIRAIDPDALVIVDVPLLMELGLESMFDCVVLVYAPRAVQKERLMMRDGYSEEEAEARLCAQMDIEEKRYRAAHVVDNGGSLDKTRKQVLELVGKLPTKR